MAVAVAISRDSLVIKQGRRSTGWTREVISLEELGLGLGDKGNIICAQFGLSPVVPRLGRSKKVGHSRWVRMRRKTVAIYRLSIILHEKGNHKRGPKACSPCKKLIAHPQGFQVGHTLSSKPMECPPPMVGRSCLNRVGL